MRLVLEVLQMIVQLVEASQRKLLTCRQILGNEVDFTRLSDTLLQLKLQQAPTTTNWRPFASHVYSLITPKWPMGSKLPSVYSKERIGG
jgi:hypothetical protein